MINKLLTQVPIGDTFRSRFGTTKGLKDFVSIILSNAVALAGIILFFLMIGGGIMMMAGAGSGNKEDVAKGKKALTSAVIGFLIIFTTYWIIKLVEAIFKITIL